jgi:hypothetical protein
MPLPHSPPRTSSTAWNRVDLDLAGLTCCQPLFAVAIESGGRAHTDGSGLLVRQSS